MTGLSATSKIGFVGAGMVGRSLAVALSQKGYTVTATASRTASSAEGLAGLVPGCTAVATADEVAEACDFVFITTPDDAIGPVTAAAAWRRGQGVAHCSGVASLDVLAAAGLCGALLGAFHPLQTFSSVEDGVRTLPGITFAIEGKGAVRSFLAEMAVALGGDPIFLRPQDKPLYHASVVMMGGLLTGLAGAVADLWQSFDVDRARALAALTPMIRGNATTLESVGIPRAVAGPYVRGDMGTIRKHLDALGAVAPGMLPTYCRMALTALPYALEKGNVPEARASEIRELLEAAIERQPGNVEGGQSCA
jgi:predicted short-subunit dehydrogenase-like oxidoreductase (DUF2520 family)